MYIDALLTRSGYTAYIVISYLLLFELSFDLMHYAKHVKQEKGKGEQKGGGGFLGGRLVTPFLPVSFNLARLSPPAVSLPLVTCRSLANPASA